MKHLGAIAGRELRSYFVSPVAYVVLVLFAVLGGFFFVASVLSFDANVSQAQQFQAFAVIIDPVVYVSLEDLFPETH